MLSQDTVYYAIIAAFLIFVKTLRAASDSLCNAAEQNARAISHCKSGTKAKFV